MAHHHVLRGDNMRNVNQRTDGCDVASVGAWLWTQRGYYSRSGSRVQRSKVEGRRSEGLKVKGLKVEGLKVEGLKVEGRRSKV
jgi:hypothetical protein